MARGYRKPPVTELKDKFVGYCAVTPNKKFMKLFERADIKNILISYHYIRKHPEHTRQIMEQINARGGLFMTDSGLFSFMNDSAFDANKFDWKAYVIEYTNWLRDNADMIFSACNLDADLFLGHDQVVEWNKTYFEPLQDMINVIYVAHQNADGKGDLAILKEYCAQYEYVAVNERMTRYVSEIYQIAKNSKTTIHGLAWTKPTLLRDFPFFSVDSVVGDSLITLRGDGRQFTTTIEYFYKAVSEYAEEDKNGQNFVQLHDIETLTLDKDNKIVWSKLDKVMMHSVQKEMYKITLEGGIKLEVTKDHSLITMDKEGKTHSIQPNELTTDSFLLYNKGYTNSNLGADNMLFTLEKKKYGKYSGEYDIKLDKTFLNFLGLWLGDGSYDGDNGINFSCYQDKECADVINEIAIRFERKVTPRPNGVDCTISCGALQKYMKHIGLVGYSGTKEIPKFIYSLSEEQIGWFLQGYYSADGSGYDASISTSSENLGKQLMDILTQMGIIFSCSFTSGKGGFSTENSVLWTISIPDTTSKKIFLNKINFLQGYKVEQTLSEIEEVDGNNQVWSKKLGVPKILSLKGNCKYGNTSAKIHQIKGWRINREQNRKFFSDKVLDSEVLFLKIINIEKYTPEEEIRVYDLCVPETEKFLANNVVVHNSSSWVNYQKYGATIFWDGANFHQYDKDRKDIRKTLKKNCEEYGVKFEEFCTEKNPDGSHNDDEGLTFSLRAWLDAFQDIKKYARTKLSVPLSRKIGNKMLKYMEQKTNNNAESGEVKKKSSPIDAIIAGALGDDVEVRDAKPIQYLQDEEGNEATLVYKREKKISIFDFMADAGDLLVCDNCHISDKCPKMKEHTSCAFDFSPKYVTENPISVLDHLITIQAERVNRATVFEKVEGGMPSKVVAQEINMLRNLNADKTNIISQVQGKGLKITQTIVEMEGRGNMIQTDGDSAPQGGVASILKGLLGA